MDNHQYNEHLTKFHADTFKDYMVKLESNNGRYGSIPPEQFIRHAFDEYSSVYNHTFAQPLLDKIRMKNEDLIGTAKYNVMYTDFPEMFWHTPDGKFHRKQLLKTIADDEAEKLTKPVKENINIEVNAIQNSISHFKYFYQEAIKDTRNDIMELYKTVTDYLEKIINEAEIITEYRKEDPELKLGALNLQDIKKAIIEVINAGQNNDKNKIFDQILNGYVKHIEKKIESKVENSPKINI